MKNKMKKMILLLTVTSMLCMTTTGCSSASVSNQNHEPVSEEDETPKDLPDNEIQKDKPEDLSDNESAQSEVENSSGKYHVLDPELAEYLDADFECMVWRLEEGSFYAAEVYNEILEDGSILTSSPSSYSTLNDSDLFQVIYDDDTYFYIRTIYDNGERYEDTDAGAEDLEEYVCCDLKGSFKNDVFYATEIRIKKVQ